MIGNIFDGNKVGRKVDDTFSKNNKHTDTECLNTEKSNKKSDWGNSQEF